jgi:ABC-type multidrug transport system fused ATPase/permease subunit
VEIKNGEKIAIVGKNGSGKTTFALCLLRILEPFSGKILIDDVDITGIGLKFLRKNVVTYVSKDSQVFEGNLKENLDPMNNVNDEEIIKEIKEFGLDYLIENENLEFFINENGSNLSLGERQLICIIRTFLNKSKILIMDEATGSLDYKTEDLIQNIIKEKLKETTVINIPHRIKTILNYDKVFVFEKGEIIEKGKPSELINNKKGIFYDLFTKSNI